MKRGFTLVETVAVTSLCSVLLAVALPAVQIAREDARDTRCRNNLKQLGLAMHNYHDVYNCFPPGWITRNALDRGHAATGWQSSILPFIEQAALYNRLEMRHGVYHDTARDKGLLTTRIDTYRCPLDSVGDTNVFRGNWGTSNYVGNFGSNPIPRWSDAAEFWPGQMPSPTIRNRARPNGIFSVNSKVRIRDCIDGTSNTFMIGERAILGKAAIWPGPRSNFNESDVVADGSFASPINCSETGYSSRHARSVVMFVLCDGSSRAISASIVSNDKTDQEMGLLQRLSARDDGMPLGQF